MQRATAGTTGMTANCSCHIRHGRPVNTGPRGPPADSWRRRLRGTDRLCLLGLRLDAASAWGLRAGRSVVSVSVLCGCIGNEEFPYTHLPWAASGAGL